MGFYFGAISVGFVGTVLMIIGVSTQKNERVFNEHKRYGKAEVVGLTRSGQSDQYTLLVRIPELNDGKLYSCSVGRIKASTYPKDSIVDVVYVQKTVAGFSIVEVHLLKDPPKSHMIIGKIITRFAIALYLISSILVIIGIIA